MSKVEEAVDVKVVAEQWVASWRNASGQYPSRMRPECGYASVQVTETEIEAAIDGTIDELSTTAVLDLGLTPIMIKRRFGDLGLSFEIPGRYSVPVALAILKEAKRLLHPAALAPSPVERMVA